MPLYTRGMFSSRLGWGAPRNPLSLLLEEMRARGEEILDLTESNPTAAGLDYPGEQILGSLNDPRLFWYEPSPAGIPQAREAVAGYYGGAVPVEQILLTASTSEAYALLFKLLADPGDEVLVPRPSYPLFEFLAALESVRPVQYPLVYHEGWSIDCDALAALIGPLTRAIILVNPNNPTGSFLKRAELARLAELCRAHDLALISDEVFSDYAFDEDPERVRSVAGQADVLAFALSGLSKVAGLPQLKLGWIVASGPAGEAAQAYERLELIADTYLSVGAPVQWAAAPLLRLRPAIQRQILDRVRANRMFLKKQLGAGSPWSLLHAEGGWYAVLEAPRVRSEEEWVLGLLRDCRVLVQPGFFYDFDREAFLILSLLTPEHTFQAGLRRLLARAD